MEHTLFISPPFGNYIHLPKTHSIKGSFTLFPRSGLFSQIIKTLRYSFERQGWINKIGLRNKGIDWAIKQYKYSNHIISIAIMSEDEIAKFVEKIPDEMNLELNISCPNTEEDLIQNNLDAFLNEKRKWCAIKLSPQANMKLVESYYNQGFRQFHCSNTLPVKNGGLSGITLIPYTASLISQITTKYNDVQVVGGGGIRNMETLNYYNFCGANYYSVSTLLFNPFLFSYFYVQYYFSD